jgi:hypothetical protein
LRHGGKVLLRFFNGLRYGGKRLRLHPRLLF